MGNPNKQNDQQGSGDPQSGDQGQFSGGQQGQPTDQGEHQGISGISEPEPQGQGTGQGTATKRQPDDSTGGQQGTFQGGETTGSPATGSEKGQNKEWSPASDKSGT